MAVTPKEFIIYSSSPLLTPRSRLDADILHELREAISVYIDRLVKTEKGESQTTLVECIPEGTLHKIVIKFGAVQNRVVAGTRKLLQAILHGDLTSCKGYPELQEAIIQTRYMTLLKEKYTLVSQLLNSYDIRNLDELNIKRARKKLLQCVKVSSKSSERMRSLSQSLQILDGQLEKELFDEIYRVFGEKNGEKIIMNLAGVITARIQQSGNDFFKNKENMLQVYYSKLVE